MRSLLARVLGVSLLVLAHAAAAQDACPPSPPSPQNLRPEELRRDIRDRGLMWRLEKDGRTSWLYGTMHASRVEWVVPGPRVQAALVASDVLALELDPGDPEVLRAFATKGDAAREQRVMAGLQERVARIAARHCVPVERLAGMRPLLQLVALGLQDARRDGFHPEFGVDAVLAGMAARLQKTLVALETPTSQLAAMLPESEADERALVELGLEDLEGGSERRLIGRLMQAWADGDAAVLADYARWCECLETEAEQRLFRRINDERNGPIADRIAALHAGGRTVFAAVGALHMTGPQGLPGLLRARGFQVQRMDFQASEAAR